VIFHCTQKLATRIPSTTDLSDPEPECDGQSGPLSSWHGHLLTLDRRQCVLFCHDATRYGLFLPGLRAPQLAELGRWHRDLFLAVLQAQGLAHHHIARAGLILGPLQMDRNTDRSVLASMNRVAGDLQFGLLRETANVMELDPIRTSLWLNDRPCTVHKKWIWPDKAMHEIVETL
jgi:hypothetical protein